jgi:sulfonate transport system substrate-binding protein
MDEITRRSFTAGAAALLAAGTTARAATDNPDTIRFGAFGAGFGQPYGVATFGVAQAKDFIANEFKDTPVKLEWTYLAGTGPAVNEGIANGRIDFAQYGALPNVIGRANGLPTRVLLNYGPTTIFGAARKGLPIHSIQDLKGRKVTFQKGTILHWAFLRAAQVNGLSAKDLTIVDLKTADQLAALAAGSVDASIGSSSVLSLREKGIVDIFYTSKDIGPKAIGFGGILVTDQFREKYLDATRRVVTGLLKAVAWIGDEANRDEALRIWSKSGTPYEALHEEFRGQSLKEAFNPLVDEFLLAQFQDVVDFSKSEKLIRSDIDVKEWVLAAPIHEALASLKLEKFWMPRHADGSPKA